MIRVVQVRGCFGSGKSTLVRAVMARLGEPDPVPLPGRRQPVGYLFREGELFVAGHYEVASGGCDTIKGMDLVYGVLRDFGWALGRDVLYEGAVISVDVNRAVALAKEPGVEFRAVCLSTPVETCLASVRARRAVRGNEKPLNEDNVRYEHRRSIRNYERMRQSTPSGRVQWLDRDAALARVCEILGVAP